MAIRNPKGICFFLFVLTLGGLPHAGHAQETARPFFDSITVGPGLVVYVGDLDGNREGNVIQHLASGTLRLHVGGYRRYGKASAGLELQVDHLHAERDPFVFSNNVVSLDLVGGYHFDLIQSNLFQIRAGLGASLLLPQYQEGYDDPVAGINKLGTRVLLTFPLSFSIQDRVRLGIRLMATDYLDGFEGFGSGSRDFISTLSVGYRFDFSR